MKAYLSKLITPVPNKLLAVHIVREYFQARILQSLQRASAMQSLAFHGGTSLRFLYNIPRYSEDLDFALELHPEVYDFRAYLRQIQRDLSAEAYTVDIKLNNKSNVHKAFVRLPGLLYELGLSGHKTEVLTIKIEVDTNPPAQAGLMTTSLNRYVPLNLHHHDRSTLFASKLHAILQREYLKGRDIYDLWWYLSQPEWPEPNLDHLNQNLQESDWTSESITTANWHSVVQDRIRPLSWPLVLDDVAPFIIDSEGQRGFHKEQLLALLN